MLGASSYPLLLMETARRYVPSYRHPSCLMSAAAFSWPQEECDAHHIKFSHAHGQGPRMDDRRKGEVEFRATLEQCAGWGMVVF